MKVVLDSYGLLRAIGAHPKLFDGIGDPVRKHASALLIAQLKHKRLDLSRYRDIRNAIAAEAFELFMDTVDDKLLKAILKKLDPHSPLAKSGSGDELRAHALDLAGGKCEPSLKQTRPARNTGAVKTAAPSSGATGPHAITAKPPGRR